MVASNRHVRKFNQMVEVYELETVDELPELRTEDRDALREHREAIERRREAVVDLGTEQILSTAERTEIEARDCLPTPGEVAADKRGDMIERLDLAVTALDELLEQQVSLDTGEFDGFDDAITTEVGSD